MVGLVPRPRVGSVELGALAGQLQHLLARRLLSELEEQRLERQEPSVLPLLLQELLADQHPQVGS